ENDKPQNEKSKNEKRWNRGLRAAPKFLALVFAAYTTKAVDGIGTLSRYINWVDEVAEWVPRLTGTAEGLAALGLVLPAATRILPWLTPLAAAGMVLMQILAISFHISRGEILMPLPGNFVLLG